MRIDPNELLKMQDRWGRWVYVSRADWKVPSKWRLKVYRSTGLSVYDHNEQMRVRDCWKDASIHRSNLRPNGYNEAEENALYDAITSKLKGEATPALPGMNEALQERVEAEAQAILEEMNRILREPLGNVSTKSGNIERESPLFYGTGNNPSLF